MIGIFVSIQLPFLCAAIRPGALKPVAMAVPGAGLGRHVLAPACAPGDSLLVARPSQPVLLKCARPSLLESSGSRPPPPAARRRPDSCSSGPAHLLGRPIISPRGRLSDGAPAGSRKLAAAATRAASRPPACARRPPGQSDAPHLCQTPPAGIDCGPARRKMGRSCPRTATQAGRALNKTNIKRAPVAVHKSILSIAKWRRRRRRPGSR